MQVPAVLRVDKKEIFALAARALGLLIEKEETFEIDDDLYMTKIKIGNAPCKETHVRGLKEFTGKPALTKKLSVHNAFSAALKYLEDAKMIQVDDYNADNVSQLKRDLFSSESWSMLFEHKAKKLIDVVGANNTKLNDFIVSFDAFYQDASAAFGFLADTEDAAAPKKKRRRQAVPPAGKEDPAPTINKLSHCLFKLHAQLHSIAVKKA
jgi:hypothetical protein